MYKRANPETDPMEQLTPGALEVPWLPIVHCPTVWFQFKKKQKTKQKKQYSIWACKNTGHFNTFMENAVKW